MAGMVNHCEACPIGTKEENTVNFARFYKPLLTGAGGILFAYFFVLPIVAWGPPKPSTNLPAEWPVNQDLAFTVSLSAQHKNFSVTSIRFYVDYHGSTARGEAGLFHPAVIYERPAAKFGGLLSTNRLTYPRTRRLEVTVPFREFAAQGLVGPGVLSGKVDVNYTAYQPRLGRRYGSDHATSGMVSVPFAIKLSQ